MSQTKTPSPLMYNVETANLLPKNVAGIGTDPEITKASDENLQATERLVKSLEERYANPNYFKVASGFLKPQLGGFFASLGSASEALGEGIEQQRAVAPTIEKMRADIAMQRVGLSQKTSADRKLQEALNRVGGITSEDVAQIEKLDLETGKIAQQKFANQGATFQQLMEAIKANTPVTELEGKFGKEFVRRNYDYLKGLVPGLPTTTVKKPSTTPETTPEVKPTAETQPASGATTDKGAPSESTPTARTPIPGLDVNSLTESAYLAALGEYNKLKQTEYKSLAERTDVQSRGGQKVFETAQQIHDVASSPSLAPIFAQFEKGNPAGILGLMFEKQNLSSTLKGMREYVTTARLGASEKRDALTKLNQLETLMGSLQTDMQNAVINPTDERTAREFASIPNMRNTQDAFLRSIRYIANEGLTKYEYQLALQRASKSPNFDPMYPTIHPEFVSVNHLANTRREALVKNPATQDRPDFMKKAIDEVASKSAKKENKRLTAKELREQANKQD